MTETEIARKLMQLRPGALWSLSGNTYEGLVWQDATQTKPTAQDIGL